MKSIAQGSHQIRGGPRSERGPWQGQQLETRVGPLPPQDGRIPSPKACRSLGGHSFPQRIWYLLWIQVTVPDGLVHEAHFWDVSHQCGGSFSFPSLCLLLLHIPVVWLEGNKVKPCVSVKMKIAVICVVLHDYYRTRHCANYIHYVLLTATRRGSTTLSPSLWMRKPGLHVATKCWGWGLIPGLSVSRTRALPY